MVKTLSQAKAKERENLVIHTMVMRFSENHALQYMKENGHNIKPRTYERVKTNIRKNTAKAKFEFMQQGLFEQHLERIRELETSLKLAWENYHLEKDPSKRTRILQIIVNMQPILSTYYEATQYVIEDDAQRVKH